MRRLLVAAVLVVVVAACGGDDQSFADAAKEACDKRAAAIDAADAQLTAQSTPEQFAAWFRQFFEPAYRAQLDAMRAAGPPDDTARALVEDTARVIDTMAADPGSFAFAADPFAGVDPRWDTYGLPACGTRT